MKKQAEKKPTKIAWHVVFLKIILAIFLLECGFVIFKIVSPRFISAFETPGSEMREIPPDVKKELSKTTSNNTATFYVPILMYHYIEYVQDKKDTIRQSLNVNPNIFEQQIQTLQGAGYTFLTARQLGDILDNKIAAPPKPILLTFDDGHRDFYTNAFPLLKKYQVHATAYIIPGFTGGVDFMTQAQLQEVATSGLVDIGAHTVHHIALKGRPYSAVSFEVGQSKAILERTYHISVVSFAYPGGSFDQQAINSIKDAGFTTAVSTIPGEAQSQKNRFFLFRLRPGSRTGKNLLSYLQNTRFKAN